PAPRPEIAAILSAPLPESALSSAGERPAEERGHPQPATPRSGTEERLPAQGGPTPKDLAALRAPGTATAQHPATATLRWSSDRGWVDRSGVFAEPSDAASMPTLAQLTTAEQRWADREEDITTVGGDPYEVGQVFARRWVDRLGDRGHLQKLSSMYPRIPHRIDGELLRYAARFGLLAHKDDQIDEHDRYAIRAGFWREIDVRTGAEHAPAGD
ncbi:NYN domain-containing protein, partial [Streptomyces mexicanus]|nr:NYN domain-containing protein [Streptomyces mexicanus]